MPPIIQNVSLPADVSDAPSVGLFAMVKNAESVIGRLLDCVLPYVSGVSLVLNDVEDATMRVVGEHMSRYPEKWLKVHVVTSATYPGFYFMDEPATYEEGLPLAGETFAGPYTHAPLLCDWARARNIGWLAPSLLCDYKLFLDADDVVLDPESIPALAKMLAQCRVDLAATRYGFGHGPGGQANSVSYRERLVRNISGICWEGATHEVLAGGLRRVLVEDALRVVDLKDNWGRGVRVPGRCFKVLYRQARLAGWKVPSRHLAYLVQESPGMMPAEWVADHLMPRYLSESTHREEEAWVVSMVGEMWESRCDLARAVLCYKSAVERFPTSKGWFRLSRARFKLHDYRGCTEAYEGGAKLVGKSSVLDDGPVYDDSSKILAAQAYHVLGRTHHEQGDVTRSRQLVREAAVAFPASRNVAALRDLICGAEEWSV